MVRAGGSFRPARYEGREEDERRLFYVGLTRAREMLVLSWFTHYVSGAPTRPSPFIRDIVESAAKEDLTKAFHCRPQHHSNPDDARTTVETTFGELYTYHECPYCYYLRHVCGFQPRLDPALNFGKPLHHAMAAFARRAVSGHLVEIADIDEVVPPNCYFPFAGRQVRERLYK